MSSRLDLGTTLAGYRIERLLGRGGMGAVYIAEDERLGRHVALKVLVPELAEDQGFRSRFLDEWQIAASLEHPHIVPIYDAGEVDGQLYIAMRYVDSDLKRLIHQEGPLEPRRALQLVSQVADALDAAHAQGLVHRDVKPGNVLLDASGNSYLCDFGLTKDVSLISAQTGTGQLVGTLDYMAPEQIRAKPFDGRADQYSLACVLYECLAGKPPFRRDNEAQVLWAHMQDEPPSLSGYPALDSVLGQALAKEKEQRYGSCGELVAAARAELGIGVEKPALLRRRRLALLLLVAGVVLLAAALIAVLLTRGGGGSGVPARKADSLVRIDSVTNKVTATIRVGRDPSAVAVGRGRIWVANFDDQTVSRIDPRPLAIQTVSVHGNPTDLAVGRGVVFVANGPFDGSIALIDEASGTVTNVIRVTRGTAFFAETVAAGEGAVWLANASEDDRSVRRLDPARGGVVGKVLIRTLHDEVHSDTTFASIAAGAGGVWVVGDDLDRTLWRIDPATARVAATIGLPSAPRDVAAGAGAVWVTGQLDDAVWRVDPETNRVVARIPVGRGAAGVATGAGSVWVANSIDGTVSRIDAKRNRVVKTIKVGSNPEAVAVGAGGVWVTSRVR
jgi:YVTN family beta-propeller protein